MTSKSTEYWHAWRQSMETRLMREVKTLHERINKLDASIAVDKAFNETVPPERIELEKYTTQLEEKLTDKAEVIHKLNETIHSRNVVISTQNKRIETLSHQLNETMDKVSKAHVARDVAVSAEEALRQRCHELAKELAALKSEKKP